MRQGSPSGRPPDWLDGLLERARAALRELNGYVRRAEDAFRREIGAGWPVIRDGFLRTKERVDGGFDRLLRRVLPYPTRAAAAVGRGWERIRPRARGVGRWIRRRSPSPRQALALAVVLFGASWILWERCGVAGCPDVGGLRSYQPGGASVLLDRTGERFADLAPMEYEVVPLDSLPEYVPAAFVAVEDRRFYEHGGVDWRRVIGAALADIRAGGLVQGSSTIPMQLSRTLFSDRIQREDKTFRRKLMEVRVAGEIEDRFTKEEILELYLNHVYFGAGSYGIQAASRYYFGKEATELELEEAALLAALPRAPAHYDPRRHPEAARARRDLVLALMARQERIAVEDAESAREEGLGVSKEPDWDPDGDRLAPYFVQHVRRLLEERLGETLYSEPLRIYTTLDATAQRSAEEELESQLRSVERGTYGWLDAPSHEDAATGPGGDGTGYLQGALVILDARGGDVRAWIGGRDYDHSRFDRARLARRQAGSAFKPFVYGAALEAGLGPSQPIMDSPYRLARSGGDAWQPENYSGRFEGAMRMREALVRSQNVPAVRLAAAVGGERVRDFARRAGISGDVPDSPVGALGVTATSPLEMATAYAAFAAGGRRPTPRFILRVEDGDGNVLMETEPAGTDAVSPATAYILTDMLRDVVDRGTGATVRRVGFRGPAAGKTGTTSDATDVWFVGYTPELVGAVWVGFDEVRPLPRRATGGGVAAPVWGRVMARVYRGRPDPEWPERPRGVVSRWIDPETGLVLDEGCEPRYGSGTRELFLDDRVPIGTCPWQSRRRFLDRVGGWLGSVFESRRVAARIPGPTDPDLGMPRLPTRGDEPESEREAFGTSDGLDRRWNDDYDAVRELRLRLEERALEEQRREEERIREARRRAEEQLREALRRQEEAAREARRREADRRRGGG
jgi:1A family penicillin-binding protein